MRREQEQLAESADSRQEEMRALEAEMAQFKEKVADMSMPHALFHTLAVLCPRSLYLQLTRCSCLLPDAELSGQEPAKGPG